MSGTVQGLQLARLPVPSAHEAAPWARTFKATRRHVVSGAYVDRKGFVATLSGNPVKVLLVALVVVFVAGALGGAS